MITLYEARNNIGRGVVYRAVHPGAEPEDGTIERVTIDYVMVRYRDGVKATAASDLEFLRPLSWDEKK